LIGPLAKPVEQTGTRWAASASRGVGIGLRVASIFGLRRLGTIPRQLAFTLAETIPRLEHTRLISRFEHGAAEEDGSFIALKCTDVMSSMMELTSLFLGRKTRSGKHGSCARAWCAPARTETVMLISRRITNLALVIRIDESPVV
jgi:hypothetical protein